MTERLFRLEQRLVRVEELLIFCAFTGLISVMLLQVTYRFVLSDPLDFTEEASRICMIWLVFIGAARAFYAAEHFLVDVLVNALPAPLRRAVGWIIDAVTIAFVGCLAWIGFRNSIFGSSQIMPALGVSVAVQTVAMPLGFLMMVFHALVFLARRRNIGVPEALKADRDAATRHEPVGV